jgi:hypothetical protein
MRAACVLPVVEYARGKVVRLDGICGTIGEKEGSRRVGVVCLKSIGSKEPDVVANERISSLIEDLHKGA